MDTLNLLLQGFATAATPLNLLLALIGVTVGTAVGVLPGIGPAMTVALLLPITYGLEPTGAMIMLAGILYGGMYGGSTTSILLNTPGESSSVVTAIEGNLMAKGGRAAQALATAVRYLKEAGAHAVKFEGGERVAPQIRALTDAGVPVVAHLGFTPQSENALGGHRVQGRGDEAAERLAEDEPELRYANLAVRGKLLDQIVADQVPVAERLRPDLIAFAAGGNDIIRPGTDPDQVAAGFDALVEKLGSQGATVVVFTGPDIGLTPVLGRLRGKVAIYNEHVHAIALKHDAVVADIDVTAGRVFNVGGGPGNTMSIWAEFGPMVESLVGRAVPVERRPARIGDQRWYVSDVAALTAATGWRPRISVGEVVERVHASVARHLAAGGGPAG